MVEHRLEIQRPEVRTPSGAQEHFLENLTESKCCADRVIGVVTCNPRVYIYNAKDKNGQVRTILIHVKVRWITETRKHCTHGKPKKEGKRRTAAARFFTGKAARNSSTLHWDKKVIKYNLI